jgi:hypothetical protein
MHKSQASCDSHMTDHTQNPQIFRKSRWPYPNSHRQKGEVQQAQQPGNTITVWNWNSLLSDTLSWVHINRYIFNVGEGRVRAQLSAVETTLLGRRHVSAPMLGHHQVSKKVSYEKTMQFGADSPFSHVDCILSTTGKSHWKVRIFWRVRKIAESDY